MMMPMMGMMSGMMQGGLLVKKKVVWQKVMEHVEKRRGIIIKCSTRYPFFRGLVMRPGRNNC